MMNGMNQIWGMGLGWFIGLMVLAVIIWLVIKVVNQKTTSNLSHNRSPLDVLKKRYVTGKIGKKEFEKKRIAIL